MTSASAKVRHAVQSWMRRARSISAVSPAATSRPISDRLTAAKPRTLRMLGCATTALEGPEPSPAEHDGRMQQMADEDEYNKRDLANAMPIERMERELNQRQIPSFEAVASEGLGVFATLKAISKLILNRLQ